jgi:serine/threonine protein kinase
MAKYENPTKIDEGGQAKIYLAYERDLGKQVILKVTNDNDGSRRRLKREARVATELNHNPFTADLIADHTDHHPPFIVYEYCSGGSLADWVLAGKSAQDVVIAIKHALLGLQGIHDRNGFHGDFTPRNLLMSFDPDGRWRIKLIDFGLGQTPNYSSGTMTRNFRGTKGYISPEVEKGDDYTWRSDIWSAGTVLREMLTGFKTTLAFTFNPPPAELTSLIDRMTAENPLLRPDTRTIITELTTYLNKPVVQMVVPTSQGAGIGGFLVLAGTLLAILANKTTYDSKVGRFRNKNGQFASGRY